MNYQPIIGLEIHVELKTKSKMFCSCPAKHFQVKPNSQTCPVCLGLPGALPVPNFQGVQWCQLIGAALKCQLAKQSKFDRKSYFYPDLPKGYQISQYDQPLAINGSYTLDNQKIIRITRVHLEEDTAKNIHQKIADKEMTLIDFNRSGVPLVEIVTEPDFNSIDEVDEFLKALQRLIRYLQVSDADMEKGSMRLEVNMSLRQQQAKHLPKYKVEIKNINSFRYVKKAIEFELKRQSQLLDKSIIPDQETRGYQEDVNRTISQRSKEAAYDYRYFPEKDIPPMVFDSKQINTLAKFLPELPWDKTNRFKKTYNLTSETAEFITETISLANFFEQALKLGDDANLSPQIIANNLKNKKIDIYKTTPKQFIEQIISKKSELLSNVRELTQICLKVLHDHSIEVEKYQAGKHQLFSFFMGQVMQVTQGKADGQMTKTILLDLLK